MGRKKNAEDAVLKSQMLIAVMMLLLGAPGVLFADNVSLRTSSGGAGQKDPQILSFRPAAEFMVGSGHGSAGTGSMEAPTALPYLVEMAKPIYYPGWARRSGAEGLLIVALEVLEDGRVGQWRIVRSTGSESLDKAASRSFPNWKFHPALKNGKPVRTVIQVPINFELIGE